MNEAILGDERHGHPPFFRATFVDDQLCMVVRPEWVPQVGTAWGDALLGDLGDGVVVADLTIVHSQGRLELLVEELNRPKDEGFRNRLIQWAELIGYRRIWIGSDVIDLSNEQLQWDLRVTTRCLGCRTEWRGDQTAFWVNARNAGAFPNVCALCGHLLPVWQERASTVTPSRRSTQTA